MCCCCSNPAYVLPSSSCLSEPRLFSARPRHVLACKHAHRLYARLQQGVSLDIGLKVEQRSECAAAAVLVCGHGRSVVVYVRPHVHVSELCHVMLSFYTVVRQRFCV